MRKIIHKKSFKILLAQCELLIELIDASIESFLKSIENIPVIDKKTGKFKFNHPTSIRKKFRERSEQIDKMIIMALERF